MNSELITADVCVANVKSVRILNKFFEVQRIFNVKDNCVDRHYFCFRD
jgi:hypothetical protein